MASPIKISIPSPCHEDWVSMTPADRGRFCAACQKTVIDFTKATDREIINTYNREDNLCGKFRPQQLDRELVIPKKRKTLWETGAAAIALLALGSAGAEAQTPPDTVQHEIIGKFLRVDKPITITGTVVDESNLPLPGVTVLRQPGIERATTDVDGRFSIEATVGDSLVFECVGYTAQKLAVTSENTYNIQLSPEQALDQVIIIGYRTQKQSYTMGAVTTIKAEDLQIEHRTFFGRIFHSIGNIFR